MSTKCGISIPQTFELSVVDVELIRKFVVRAEALGYDSLWVQEQMISDAAILEPGNVGQRDQFGDARSAFVGGYATDLQPIADIV